EYRKELVPGKLSYDVARVLENQGIRHDRACIAGEGDGLAVSYEPVWSTQPVRLRIHEDKKGFGVYGPWEIDYGITGTNLDDTLSVQALKIRRERRLPDPVVCYAQHDVKGATTEIAMYWFYYLLDRGTGPHVHDGEHAFVFYDVHDEPVAVAAT